MIGWLLRRWQRRYPGPVFAASITILVGGTALLGWWVLRDLARGQVLRPSLAVLALAFLAVRVIAMFKPYKG